MNDYRLAQAEDAAQCLRLRGMTRQNAFTLKELEALGITEESWAAGIKNEDIVGIVFERQGQMLGYCFGDTETGEILVLAVMPECEGQGIGKALLAQCVSLLYQRGFVRLFLSCSADPDSRSFGFYRYLGWRETGERDDLGDDVLELCIKA